MPPRRPAVVLAAALTICSATPHGQTRASQIQDLQRLVFGIGDPSFPETPEKFEAQLQLAEAYARGDGLDQDPELACGLAMAARFALSVNEREDGPVYEQTRETERRLCAGVHDPQAAVRLGLCPRFGLEPRTLALGSDAARREPQRLDDRGSSRLTPRRVANELRRRRCVDACDTRSASPRFTTRLPHVRRATDLASVAKDRWHCGRPVARLAAAGIPRREGRLEPGGQRRRGAGLARIHLAIADSSPVRRGRCHLSDASIGRGALLVRRSAGAWHRRHRGTFAMTSRQGQDPPSAWAA